MFLTTFGYTELFQFKTFFTQSTRRYNIQLQTSYVIVLFPSNPLFSFSFFFSLSSPYHSSNFSDYLPLLAVSFSLSLPFLLFSSSLFLTFFILSLSLSFPGYFPVFFWLSHTSSHSYPQTSLPVRWRAPRVAAMFAGLCPPPLGPPPASMGQIDDQLQTPIEPAVSSFQ